MSFSVFTILFITTTVLLYYIVPARLRAVFLLLVSWYFIAHTSPRGLYVLIALHVLGALKHQFVDRDNVLHRMIPLIPRRP